jgi:hypothetical protein
MTDSRVNTAGDTAGAAARPWTSQYDGLNHNSTSTHSPASSDAYGQIGRYWVACQQEVANRISSEAWANEPVGSRPTKSEVTSDLLAPSSTTVVGMHKWAGEIIEIEDDVLTADFVPVDQDGPTFTADFDLKLLGPDRRLAKPGGTVYLTTRFIEGDSGYPEAMTNLRLRRPRRWSARELADTVRRARATAARTQRHAE